MVIIVHTLKGFINPGTVVLKVLTMGPSVPTWSSFSGVFVVLSYANQTWALLFQYNDYFHITIIFPLCWLDLVVFIFSFGFL